MPFYQTITTTCNTYQIIHYHPSLSTLSTFVQGLSFKAKQMLLKPLHLVKFPVTLSMALQRFLQTYFLWFQSMVFVKPCFFLHFHCWVVYKNEIDWCFCREKIDVFAEGENILRRCQFRQFHGKCVNYILAKCVGI
jgi:hypothetical protein